LEVLPQPNEPNSHADDNDAARRDNKKILRQHVRKSAIAKPADLARIRVTLLIIRIGE
jgi:hypothetical protein